MKGDDNIDGRYYLYAIRVTTPDGKAPLDGSVVVDAVETYAQRGAEAEASMTMNGEGTQEWARMTGTRTQVAETRTSECMILRVSLNIFISSFV